MALERERERERESRNLEKIEERKGLYSKNRPLFICTTKLTQGKSVNSLSGITLIALVVTIVVLLILASVSITVVFGDNGILQLAKEAADKTNEAVQGDKESIGNLTNYINSLNWDTTKVTAVTTKDGGIVPVPKGFVGSEIDGENTIKDGFVIYQIPEGQSSDWKEDNDNDGILDVQQKYNQFVWVPVFDETPIYKTNSEGKNIGLLYDFGGYNDSQEKFVAKEPPTPIEWSDTGFREPDTVKTWVETNSIEHKGDDNEENLSIVLEEGEDKTEEKFKEQLQREFDNLIASVNKYGGFYIGRYETSGLKDEEIPIVQAGKAPTTETTWYRMYKNSKKIASQNDSVTSSMIWGCQWDAVMNWFLTDKKISDYVTNSTGWYKDVTGYDDVTNSTHLTGIDLKQGDNIVNRVKNIYDMGGNVNEWTIEADTPWDRGERGGDFGNHSSAAPACYRHYYIPTCSYAFLGSRATLYANL